MNKLISLASLTTLVFAAACGGGSTNTTTGTPTTQEYDDIAHSVGSTAATSGGGGDTGTISDVVQISTGTMPLGFALDAAGHVTGALGDLTFDLLVTCTDASGNSQAVCARGTTDGAHVNASVMGNLDLGDFSAMVQHNSDWHLAGLTGATATLTGTGAFSYDSTFSGAVSSSYTLDVSTTYAGVAIDTASRKEVAGTITYDVTAKHMTTTGNTTSERDLAVHGTLTFAADGTATLQLDGGRTYSVNLSTGATVYISG